jgi:hypothetical protein
MVSMTRVVLACSDIFAQDLEDLPVEVREAVVGAETEQKPDLKPPQRKSESAADAPPPASGPHVVAVSERTGETNGKKWALYVVKLSDGREGSTFDVAIRDAALALKASNATVEAVFEGRNGKSKIIELGPVA